MRTSAIGSMPSQVATSAWLTPSFPAMLRITAACWRVIASPICRARCSKRRLISRETSWTRNPKARPTSDSAGIRSNLADVARSLGFTAGCAGCETSFGAMTALHQGWSRNVREGFLRAGRAVGTAEPAGEAFEIEGNHWGGVERQPLREQQPADDRDAERPAQLGTGTPAERDRHRAEQCREGRHHDRPKPQ